ncbi:MAG: hypothetical protein WDN72_07295 [Alphaproteobacteria bacterium]
MSAPKLLAIAASQPGGVAQQKAAALAVAQAEAAGASVTLRDYAEYDAPIYRGEKEGLPEGRAQARRRYPRARRHPARHAGI